MHRKRNSKWAYQEEGGNQKFVPTSRAELGDRDWRCCCHGTRHCQVHRVVPLAVSPLFPCGTSAWKKAPLLSEILVVSVCVSFFGSSVKGTVRSDI
eukprot:scaffold3743_cov66-Cylindrotheca_fusiformis.AAC.1